MKYTVLCLLLIISQSALGQGAGFEEEALRALRQWVYTPYAISDQPVVVRTTLTVHFEMR